MFSKTRDYVFADVRRIAANHHAVDARTFEYYAMYIQEFETKITDRSINSTDTTAHDFAVRLLRHDDWRWDQINPCAQAYAQADKFIKEVKAQGIKFKESR